MFISATAFPGSTTFIAGDKPNRGRDNGTDEHNGANGASYYRTDLN
jgi:hypothetical protein